MSCYVNHILSLFCCMPALKLNSDMCWWIVHLYLFFEIFHGIFSLQNARSPCGETRETGPVEIARHFKNTNSGGWATLTKLEVIQAGSFKFLLFSWWLIDKFNKKGPREMYVFELTFKGLFWVILAVKFQRSIVKMGSIFPKILGSKRKNELPSIQNIAPENQTSWKMELPFQMVPFQLNL